jgi:5-formyltetrahydrofolate cyclo-ligase
VPEEKDLSQIEGESNRLRRRAQSVLRSLSLDAYRTESNEIVRLLASWDVVHQATVIAAFHPSRTEPQLQTLLQSIAHTKTLLLPRVLPGSSMELVQISDLHQDLHPATFGLMEPRLILRPWTGKSPDIFLIPGVVFGKSGERIGHGGGYYDRFLAKHPNSLKIGVALNCQIHKGDIPQLPHDIRMSYIVSPIGIFPTGV